MKGKTFLMSGFMNEPELPPQQLESALNRHANLRGPLASYASQPTIKSTLSRSTLAVLGLANETHVQQILSTSLHSSDTRIWLLDQLKIVVDKIDRLLGFLDIQREDTEKQIYTVTSNQECSLFRVCDHPALGHASSRIIVFRISRQPTSRNGTHAYDPLTHMPMEVLETNLIKTCGHGGIKFDSTRTPFKTFHEQKFSLANILVQETWGTKSTKPVPVLPGVPS
ncbi:unnamed protein product [Sphenostylis stenocarpa]|uniref:Uncharacterized protein n=1 Tax=Sphenostylis stenocarpa TaxID=92480 RepID=A0AA86VTB3_9FABA|nr:unnamed protein product [Sphenostylis stenocarpa]